MVNIYKMKKKKSKKFSPLKKRTKWLVCSRCNIEEIEVDDDVISVICGRCTQKLVEPPQAILKKRREEEKKSNRPRGWQFMKVFVDGEGNVFHKGKEQPKLKGTLPTTIIKPKEKKSVFQREQERLKKEKKLANRYKNKQTKKKKQLNKKGKK